jgi:hypothetical protein
VACPNQATRTPSAGGALRSAPTNGTGLLGRRVSLSRAISRRTPGPEDGGAILAGTVLTNTPSRKCGDRRIRSSRSPLGRPPRAAGTRHPAPTSAPTGRSSAERRINVPNMRPPLLPGQPAHPPLNKPSGTASPPNPPRATSTPCPAEHQPHTPTTSSPTPDTHVPPPACMSPSLDRMSPLPARMSPLPAHMSPLPARMPAVPARMPAVPARMSPVPARMTPSRPQGRGSGTRVRGSGGAGSARCGLAFWGQGPAGKVAVSTDKQGRGTPGINRRGWHRQFRPVWILPVDKPVTGTRVLSWARGSEAGGVSGRGRRPSPSRPTPPSPGA